MNQKHSPPVPDEVGLPSPERRLAAVVETLSELIVVVSDDGRIAYASRAADRLLHRPAAYLVGQPLAALVHADDRRAVRELLGSVGPARPRATAPGEIRLSHVDGSWVDAEASVTDLRSDPDVGGLVLELRDATAKRTFEESLRHQAKHDALTGLANRILFQDVLRNAMARAQESPTRPHALLFVDIDGFKRINDSFGHAVGDEVLATIGDRLRTRVRPGDTAARLGGDEFAVLVEHSSQPDAELVAQRVLEAVSQPFRIQGRDMVLSASIGIALTTTERSPEELLRDADVAMYEAKTAGKARYQVFRAEMQAAARRRVELEADLRRAIERHEFVLHFQPIVALITDAVVGVEALVRWNHPARGQLPPGEFIEACEESGMIVPLGSWILQEACQRTASWLERFPYLTAGFRLHVNVSVRQIEEESFVQEVSDVVAATGLEPGTLTLEITESLILRDFALAVTRLQELKRAGVNVAIDDFGTGYSSLRYLKLLPVDELKIDRSFIEDVATGPEQAAVALAVIKLARTFGLTTVAEGIENERQVTALIQMGAENGQGFHYAPPMAISDIDRYLSVRRLR